MAKLTPVDYDPFAQAPTGPKLTPVDFDPFAPKQRGMADELKRQGGLTARYALEGVGSAIGVFSDPIAAGLNAIVPGDPFGQLGDTARYAADTMGLPQPENSLERVVGSGSRALAGTAATMGVAAPATRIQGALGSASQGFVAMPGSQLVAAASGGSASQAAAEGGAGPGGQALAGLLGAVAPSASAGGIRGLLRGGEQGRKNMLGVIDDFQRSGAGTPTVGQATERWSNRGLEALLGRTPGGAGVMARTAESQQTGMGDRVRRVADSLSTKASPEQAGRGIERGITGPGGFMQDFRRKATALYDEVDNFVPPQTPIPVSATKATLDKLASPTPGAMQTSRVLASGKVADLRDALDADLQASLAAAGRGELPYQAVKALRTRLGDLIADSTFATDMPTKQLREVYGALSDDMNRAVQATNNPQAIQAVSRANNFYRAGMGRMDVLERVIERNGGPEKVFAAATSGTREGATTLRAVMQSLPEDGQKQLSAAVLRRLGRANPSAQDDIGEVFSSETFLKNWNTLSNEAKSTLFGRFGPGYVGDVEAIARAAANVREGSQVFRNPPGTAAASAQLVTSGAFVLSLLSDPTVAAGIAAGVAGANGTARLMSNPRFVKWLAAQTKVPISALPVQVAKLKAEATAEGDEETLALVRDLEQQAINQQANAARQ